MSLFSKKDPHLKLEQDRMSQETQNVNRQIADSEESNQFHKQERQDLLRWQQDLDDGLEQLKHDLRREVFDYEKEIWVQEIQISGFDENNKPIYQKLKPIMNERGIRMIECLLRPLLSRNLINSNLDEQMVYGMLRRTSDTLVNNIIYFNEEYDLEFGEWGHVMRLVKNVMIPTPFRAAMGWNKKMDSTISKRLESHTEGFNNRADDKGFFARVLNK